MNVVVKAGQASVLVQDAFHVPLLEVSLGTGGCARARRARRACCQLAAARRLGLAVAAALQPAGMRPGGSLHTHRRPPRRPSRLHSTHAVEAGVRGPSSQVVQAYLGLRLGVWSYNGGVRHWEPVVEPWDVIAQCAANYGGRVSGGGGPRAPGARPWQPAALPAPPLLGCCSRNHQAGLVGA